jgi:hypothetical protein
MAIAGGMYRLGFCFASRIAWKSALLLWCDFAVLLLIPANGSFAK